MPWFELKEISLEEIDFEKTQKIAFSFPLNSLPFLEALKKGRPFYPPLLYPTERGYVIVDGKKRIEAFKTLNIMYFQALLFKEKLSEKELLLKAFFLNLPRGLNLVEKALFLEKAKAFFEPSYLLELLPELGFSKNPNWLFFLEKVLLLEEPFKLLLAEEKLNPKVVSLLSELSPKERQGYLLLLERLRLTFSEQKEVLEILLDYKKRSNSKELLPEELRTILEIEDLNKRREEAFSYLYKIKYPYYFTKLQELDRLRDFFFQRGIKFDLSPYLEKKEIFLQFKAQNLEELREKLNFLANYGEKIFSLFE